MDYWNNPRPVSPLTLEPIDEKKVIRNETKKLCPHIKHDNICFGKSTGICQYNHHISNEIKSLHDELKS